MPSLFAVYLGGRAPKCNTELHDVVFVVGEHIRDCKAQMTEKWFGNSHRLHVDSFIELKAVDGHVVTLTERPAVKSELKLYFVNLGAYKRGYFTEIHENRFYVCRDKNEAKARARAELCTGMQQVHTDDLFDVDDLLEIDEVAGYALEFRPEPGARTPDPTNGYFPFEKL